MRRFEPKTFPFPGTLSCQSPASLVDGLGGLRPPVPVSVLSARPGQECKQRCASLDRLQHPELLQNRCLWGLQAGGMDQLPLVRMLIWSLGVRGSCPVSTMGLGVYTTAELGTSPDVVSQQNKEEKAALVPLPAAAGHQ